MSLFAMLNWHSLWFKPGGQMSRTGYADLVTQLIVGGTANLASPGGQALPREAAE